MAQTQYNTHALIPAFSGTPKFQVAQCKTSRWSRRS